MLRRDTARVGARLTLHLRQFRTTALTLRALSGLDAGFLYIETAEMPMHVGSLTIYDPPADLHGGFAARVREHLARRLHLAPLLHQRLQEMPLGLGHPVWVEAGDLDLHWHVAERKLKRPGSMRQLEALVAELHAVALDRRCPLWQFTVIEGLSDGRVALYSKVHHAALDGAAGVQLAHAMMDLGPVPRAVEPAPSKRSRQPGRRKLLGELFSNSIAQYAKLARTLPDAAKAAAGVARGLGERLGELRTLQERLLAPRTRFNTAIEAPREFRTLSLPLDQAKACAAACGVTLNDLLMATVSGALRRYLARHHDLPRRSLVAAVPFSLRAVGDDRMTNQVTMLPATLATDARDPKARLAAIHAGMNELKTTTASLRRFIPTDFPSLGAPWLVGGLSRLLSRTRLAGRLPLPANLVISNVPGPPVPLYLAGARMRAYYPVSIVVHGLALNITVHSYDGQLYIGVIACAKAMPDLDRFIDDLRQAFDELRTLGAQALAPATKSTKSRPTQRRASAPRKPAKKVAKKSTAVRSRR